MIHDTQSAQFSQKQDERNIYVIMKTMCPPGYHHKGFVATVHHVPKFMSCHKAIVVITGRAHCFHDYICICIMYIYIFFTYSFTSFTFFTFIFFYAYICIFLYFHILIIVHFPIFIHFVYFLFL